jgi:O-antigen ligase
MLGTCVLILVALTWTAPNLAGFFPFVLLACAGLWYVVSKPLLHLSLVLASFAVVADFEEGIDVWEVLFGVFYATYLGIWLFRHVFLYKEKLLRSTTDRLVVLILLCVTFSIFVGWLWGAKLPNAFREWQSWTMFAFYFPVKDACRRYPNGVRAILIATIVAALFVTVRNVIQLKSLVSAAAEIWQITKKGRIIANEVILVSGGLIALVAVLHFRRMRSLLAVSLLLITFLLGLVLTQSRGYWAGFALGSFAIFLLADRGDRIKIVTLAAGSLGVGLFLMVVLFGEFAQLLFAGLLDRVLSLGSTTTDMSLVNRFLEIGAAWESIRVNPILGYGLGSEFSFFDLTISGTRTWSFIHNGYVGLWFKFGILGTALIMIFWIRSITTGVRRIRQKGISDWASRGCMVSVAVLVSFLVSSMTANPFYLSDTLLTFGVFGGMNAAATDR